MCIRLHNGGTTLRPRGSAARTGLFSAGLLSCILSGVPAAAAELSVADLKMPPRGRARVVVSGAIDGQSTYGTTIMLELVGRPGSSGRVEFTPVLAAGSAVQPAITILRKAGEIAEVRVAKVDAADMDVVQLQDPWPERGTFSPFDTDGTGSSALNGSVDDDGTFTPAPVSFTGPLASFPVRASADAGGVWDVTLTTSRGDSGWEGVPTTLLAGTITVSADACSSNADCRDSEPCTVDTCDAGTCRHERNDAGCSDKQRSRVDR